MITERAMLAAVHISIWTAVKHDRKISRDVADQHGAHQGAGRYNKQLLRGADKLDELRTLAGQVRQYFYKITLPWSDEGFRLLPSNLYFDLTTRMREFEASFEQGVESFLQIYPQYIEQVRPELNGLFREEDYPAADKLRRKFGVKLDNLAERVEGTRSEGYRTRQHSPGLSRTEELSGQIPRTEDHSPCRRRRIAFVRCLPFCKVKGLY